MKLTTILRAFISTIIIIILFYKIGMEKIIGTFLTINFLYLIPIIIILFLTIIISAYNLYMFIIKFKKIKFKKILVYQFLGWALGLISIGKLSDLAMVYFLKREKLNTGKMSAIVFLNMLITLILETTIALIAACLYFGTREISQILALILIGMLILIFLLSEQGRDIINKFVLRKYAKNFNGFNRTLKILIKNKRGIIKNFIFTLLKTVLGGLTIVILFKSINVNISIITTILFSSIITIISLLPITINGLGIKESVGAYLYSMMGISAEATITIYILYTIITYSIGILTTILIKIKN